MIEAQGSAPALLVSWKKSRQPRAWHPADVTNRTPAQSRGNGRAKGGSDRRRKPPRTAWRTAGAWHQIGCIWCRDSLTNYRSAPALLHHQPRDLRNDVERVHATVLAPARAGRPRRSLQSCRSGRHTLTVLRRSCPPGEVRGLSAPAAGETPGPRFVSFVNSSLGCFAYRNPRPVAHPTDMRSCRPQARQRGPLTAPATLLLAD